MSDEVASAALSSSQKAVEATLELIKILAPLVKQFLSEVYHKSVDGINAVGGKIADARAAGTVSNKGLIAQAQKANSPVSVTSNFLARDAERLVEKAKEYKIPVSVVGNGEKVTVEFLDRDKGIVEQITNELIAERVKDAPQSLKCFSVGENNVSSMKVMFEENGIECQFTRSADGKVKCIYPAENAEQVEVIKSDYKKIHNDVAEKFSVERNENGGVSVSDSNLEKSFSLTPLNKSQVSNALQEKLGYSPAQADIAANKLCYELGLDKQKYFAKPTQLDNIKALQSNIRYQSDDITIRDVRYDAVYFKDGNEPHIILQNGEKAVGLTPSKMTENEMRDMCVNQLGLTEHQAEKAVAKAEKINNQIRSKVEERTIDDKGISVEMHIERVANNAFTVSMGEKSRTYNFSMVGVEDNIARDFKVLLENAKNCVSKAQNQSVLQNKIRSSLKKKKPTTTEAPKVKLNESKGLKR